jgi:hypothetical protein
MALKTLQNFYSATVASAWDTGTGTVYVSALPTPTSGRLVVNPSNTTKREIVSYSSVGTDGNGNFIVLSERGVGGTTDQVHDINEPVRMNITAEYYSDVQTELDDLQDEIDTKPTISSGAVAPASTPSKIGDIYVDTIAQKLYFAAGIDSSTGWIITN